jgi:archaellum component FlaF (FlaF/FlaG flagellin family)
MSFVINAIQSYSNIMQSYDSVSSVQNNNQSRVDAIKNFDMNVISQVGPSDSTVQALSQADKKMVLQNASNDMKKQFLEAWQESLDERTKKELAKDFNIFGDI